MRKPKSDADFGRRIRMPNSDAGFGNRIRRQNPEAEFGGMIRMQNPEAQFGDRIRTQKPETEFGWEFRRHELEAEFGGRVLNDGGRSVGGWDAIWDIIQVSSGTAYFPAYGLSNTQNQSWGCSTTVCSHSFASSFNEPVGLVLLCCCRSNSIWLVEQHNTFI